MTDYDQDQFLTIEFEIKTQFRQKGTIAIKFKINYVKIKIGDQDWRSM